MRHTINLVKGVCTFERKNGMLIACFIPFFHSFSFLLVPLVSMIYSSFQNEGGASLLLSLREIFTNAYYYQSFKNSILISLLSSVVAIILAIFAAYSITFSKKIQDRILILANLTSNFAGIPLAFAFIVLLGNSGLFHYFLKLSDL